MKLPKKIFRKRNKSKYWLLASLFSSIFLLFSLYYFGAIPLLYVNSQPIYAPEVVRLVDNYGFRGAIDKVVEYKIVQLEARRRNIQITARDRIKQYQRIDAEAERQGLTVMEMIAESDQTYDEFTQNVETTITVYKLLGEDLYITEEEVDEYFENNELLFTDVDNDQLREDVKQILFDEKVSQKYIDFIKEAKARSDIDYFLLTE